MELAASGQDYVIIHEICHIAEKKLHQGILQPNSPAYAGLATAACRTGARQCSHSSYWSDGDIAQAAIQWGNRGSVWRQRRGHLQTRQGERLDKRRDREGTQGVKAALMDRDEVRKEVRDKDKVREVDVQEPPARTRTVGAWKLTILPV